MIAIPSDRTAARWLASILLLCLALGPLGCGSGTAAISGGGGGGGGGGKSAAPVTVTLELPSPAVFPAPLVVTLFDQKSRPQDIVLEYQLPGEGSTAAQPMTLFGGGETTDLPSGPPPGVSTKLLWDFESDLGTRGLTQGVTVSVRIDGKGGDPGQVLDIGNDAAAVDQLSLVSTGEPTGDVQIQFRVRDTAGQGVQMLGAFRLASDPQFRPATLIGGSTFSSSPEGELHTVTWDSLVDVPGRDEPCDFVLGADDGFTAPAELLSSPPLQFTIDNNGKPFVQLQEAAFVTHTDRHRGVPVPLLVTDAEKDSLQVIVQWTRPGQGFRTLPQDPAGLEQVLADPLQRREFRIATEFRTSAEGRLVPVDTEHVRLPELLTHQSSILVEGLAGRVLEILRPHRDPRPASAGWGSQPLSRPTAVAPKGVGTRGVVLDSPTPGRYRVSEMGLGSGRAGFVHVESGLGTPSAMSMEPGEQAVVVASHVFGSWSLDRVDLATSTLTRLASYDNQPLVFGPPRGVLSLGANATVFLVDDSLLHVEHSNPSNPVVSVLRSGLSRPSGLALHPSDPRKLYLGQRSPGPDECDGPGLCDEISVFDLTTHELSHVPQFVDGVPGRYLRQPRALAFAAPNRLLVLTQPAEGGFQVDELYLGARGGFELSPQPWPLPGNANSLATGPHGLVVLAMPLLDDLAIGGGIIQRRLLQGGDGEPVFDQNTATVRVQPPLDPRPEPGQIWRLDRSLDALTSRLVSQPATFVWDARDVVEGDVLLRVQVRDKDIGQTIVSTGPKQVRFAGQTLSLDTGVAAGDGAPADVRARDLDGDGDVDLVVAMDGNDRSLLFEQLTPGVFGPPAGLTEAVPGDRRPQSLAVADADADGRGDVLVGLTESPSVALHRHGPDGSFTSPDFLSSTRETWSVHLAQLTGDETLDAVSIHGGQSGTANIHAQQADGSFDRAAEPPAAFLGPPFLRGIATLDANGDGDLDLALSTGVVRLYDLVPGGPAEVAIPGGFAQVDAAAGSGGLAVADLDRDGDQDLVKADSTNDVVRLIHQTAPGSFEVFPSALGSNLDFADPSVPVVADLDADGDLDIVTANTGSNDLGLFTQVQGVFDRSPSLLGSSTATNSPRSLDATDVDGDGRTDLVVPTAGANQLTVFLQARPGVYSDPPRELGGFVATESPSSVQARDIDGDGDVDLIATHPTQGHLAFTEQTVFGFFQPQPVLVGVGALSSPYDVEAVDLDGDGRLDLATADGPGNQIVVFQQDSFFAGIFTESQRLGGAATTGDTRSIDAGDLDGNGFPDLVSGNLETDTLTVFLQNGSGQFGDVPLVLGSATTTLDPGDVLIADLDADGLNDVVSANTLGASLSIFYQSNTGLPATPDVTIPLPTPSAPVAVRAADLDQDGDLDLVVADRDGSRLVRVEQSASRRFTVLEDIDVGSGPASPGRPRSVVAADLDVDGDIDLATGAYALDWLQVFEQVRPGVFEGLPVLGNPAVTDQPVALEVADLDGDGELELISANEGGNSVSLYWNGH